MGADAGHAARPSADSDFIDLDMLFRAPPPKRSWSVRIMPARSLCRMPKAGSYCVTSRCRRNVTADIPIDGDRPHPEGTAKTLLAAPRRPPPDLSYGLYRLFSNGLKMMMLMSLFGVKFDLLLSTSVGALSASP